MRGCDRRHQAQETAVTTIFSFCFFSPTRTRGKWWSIKNIPFISRSKGSRSWRITCSRNATKTDPCRDENLSFRAFFPIFSRSTSRIYIVDVIELAMSINGVSTELKRIGKWAWMKTWYHGSGFQPGSRASPLVAFRTCSRLRALQAPNFMKLCWASRSETRFAPSLESGSPSWKLSFSQKQIGHISCAPRSFNVRYPQQGQVSRPGMATGSGKKVAGRSSTTSPRPGPRRGPTR